MFRIRICADFDLLGPDRTENADPDPDPGAMKLTKILKNKPDIQPSKWFMYLRRYPTFYDM